MNSPCENHFGLTSYRKADGVTNDDEVDASDFLLFLIAYNTAACP